VWIIKSKKDRIFAKRIKHTLFIKPSNITYYKIALSHRTKPIKVNGKWYTNETLEFLGDAVLNLIAANFLRNHYPDKSEGELSRMRSNLVARKQLNKVASRLHIAKLIAKSRYANIRTHVIGNTLEAIFGAIFLDKGYNQAEKFFMLLIEKEFILTSEYEANKNFKSILLEKASKEKFKVEFVSFEKEINNKLIFKSFVFINKTLFAEGIGTRKKASEQLAAKRALKNLTL
jgi:ribonuclease-3